MNSFRIWRVSDGRGMLNKMLDAGFRIRYLRKMDFATLRALVLGRWENGDEEDIGCFPKHMCTDPTVVPDPHPFLPYWEEGDPVD